LKYFSTSFSEPYVKPEAVIVTDEQDDDLPLYGQKILCSGMKEALDRYITSNYAEVRAYTAYFLSKMGSYIDADTVINNSYLHVVNIDGDPEKVKGYLLNTIKYQVLWSTSKSHRDDRITAIEHPNILSL
jgi:hypothetical protein